MTNVARNDWDWKDVRDFVYLADMFNNDVLPEFADGDELCKRTGATWNKAHLKQATVDLGVKLRKELDLEIADIGSEGSRFFKEVYINPSRLGAQVREDQVEDSLDD